MAISPYTGNPRDETGEIFHQTPAPYPAAVRWPTSTAAVSSVITLSDNTTTLEVGAIGGGGIAIKWIATSDTQASVLAAGAANFDNFIPANAVRRFAIPREGIGTSSIVGANKQNGLYNRVAWIAVAAPSSSIIASEYA